MKRKTSCVFAGQTLEFGVKKCHNWMFPVSICFPLFSGPLACYTTDIDGQFRNKTVKECDKDVSNCMSYYYLYKNNTEVSGKGCAKDSECKNTTKTCETVKKKQAFIARCNIWCCQTSYCNNGSPQIHVLILILAFSLGSSIMCT
jgi:hypothetical protein